MSSGDRVKKNKIIIIEQEEGLLPSMSELSLESAIERKIYIMEQMRMASISTQEESLCVSFLSFANLFLIFPLRQ